MKKTLIFVLTLLGSTILPADTESQAGKDKAFTCMGCHGQEGIRNAYPGYDAPRLGGQNQAYLSIALQGYRSGERSHPTMRGHASSLSDQDIENIAAYFASISNN